MNVSAIIVTRGDVSLQDAMAPIPDEWEKLVWSNGSGLYRWKEDIAGPNATWQPIRSGLQDLSVYGRYHAIEYASGEIIYVQDDDCVVSDPEAIVRAYYEDMVVCNMPPEFRHDFYTDHALVGFGAAFHRDAPERAFNRWLTWSGHRTYGTIPHFGGSSVGHRDFLTPFFLRTCDIVFTGLSDTVLVDVPKTNLGWAEAPNRMWKQATHQDERAQMREFMLAARRETQ